MSSPCPGVNRASSLIQHSAAETEKHVTPVSLCVHNQCVCLCMWRPLTTVCSWCCTADSVLSRCCTSTQFADPPSRRWDNDPHRTRRPESSDTLRNAPHPEDTHTHGETLKYIQPELFCTHPHGDKEATSARFIWLFSQERKARNAVKEHRQPTERLTGPWQEAEPLRGRHSAWQAMHVVPSAYSRTDLHQGGDTASYYTAICWMLLPKRHLALIRTHIFRKGGPSWK